MRGAVPLEACLKIPPGLPAAFFFRTRMTASQRRVTSPYDYFPRLTSPKENARQALKEASTGIGSTSSSAARSSQGSSAKLRKSQTLTQADVFVDKSTRSRSVFIVRVQLDRSSGGSMRVSILPLQLVRRQRENLSRRGRQKGNSHKETFSVHVRKSGGARQKRPQQGAIFSCRYRDWIGDSRGRLLKCRPKRPKYVSSSAGDLWLKTIKEALRPEGEVNLEHSVRSVREFALQGRAGVTRG
jgi:hypothetical protein